MQPKLTEHEEKAEVVTSWRAAQNLHTRCWEGATNSNRLTTSDEAKSWRQLDGTETWNNTNENKHKWEKQKKNKPSWCSRGNSWQFKHFWVAPSTNKPIEPSLTYCENWDRVISQAYKNKWGAAKQQKTPLFSDPEFCLWPSFWRKRQPDLENSHLFRYIFSI